MGKCKRCGADKASKMVGETDVFLTLACELCIECVRFDCWSKMQAQLTIWDAIDAA